MSEVTGDRLYALELRPQEFSLYGEAVRFQVRYAPVADDLGEPATEHPKVLILEAVVDVQGPDEQPMALTVLKIGWEATITTPTALPASDLVEHPAEVRLLLARIGDTVNDLARRAGLEALLGPDVIDGLVDAYLKVGQAPQ